MAFMGCKDSDNDDSRPEPDAIEVTTEKYTNGQILRNTVIMLNGSDDVYYEYFTFSSETEGAYALYKSEHGQNNAVTEYNGKVLPTTFAYDGLTGKFTFGDTENPMLESYTYKYTVGNSDYFGMAAETLVGSDGSTGGSFYKTWKSSLGSGTEYRFTAEGDAYACTVNDELNMRFAITNGKFSVGDVPFFWGKLNNETVLYCFAYDTERKTVEAVGRNALRNGMTIDISLGRFIFAALN